MKRKGSLLYTIRPIQAALDLFYARQIVRMDKDVAKQRAAAKQATLASVSPCEPLCGPLESAASPSPTEDGLSGIEAVSDEMKDERKSGIKDRHRKRHPGRAQLPAPRAVTGDSQVR